MNASLSSLLTVRRWTDMSVISSTTATFLTCTPMLPSQNMLPLTAWKSYVLCPNSHSTLLEDWRGKELGPTKVFFLRTWILEITSVAKFLNLINLLKWLFCGIAGKQQEPMAIIGCENTSSVMWAEEPMRHKGMESQCIGSKQLCSFSLGGAASLSWDRFSSTKSIASGS